MGFDAEWGVLGANAIGANHKRERIWILVQHQRTARAMRVASDGDRTKWDGIAKQDSLSFKR